MLTVQQLFSSLEDFAPFDFRLFCRYVTNLALVGLLGISAASDISACRQRAGFARCQKHTGCQSFAQCIKKYTKRTSPTFHPAIPETSLKKFKRLSWKHVNPGAGGIQRWHAEGVGSRRIRLGGVEGWQVTLDQHGYCSIHVSRYSGGWLWS